MMYGRLNVHLPIALPREKRSELAAVLRRYRMVKAVLVASMMLAGETQSPMQ